MKEIEKPVIMKSLNSVKALSIMNHLTRLVYFIVKCHAVRHIMSGHDSFESGREGYLGFNPIFTMFKYSCSRGILHCTS